MHPNVRIRITKFIFIQVRIRIKQNIFPHSSFPHTDRLIFRRLLDQNKIYNIIHYSRVACTQSKSGFSTNYCSIVVFRCHPLGWIILGN